jgi:hypothetical protein
MWHFGVMCQTNLLRSRDVVHNAFIQSKAPSIDVAQISRSSADNQRLFLSQTSSNVTKFFIIANRNTPCCPTDTPGLSNTDRSHRIRYRVMEAFAAC